MGWMAFDWWLQNEVSSYKTKLMYASSHHSVSRNNYAFCFKAALPLQIKMLVYLQPELHPCALWDRRTSTLQEHWLQLCRSGSISTSRWNVHLFARLCIHIHFSQRKIFSGDLFQCKTRKSKEDGSKYIQPCWVVSLWGSIKDNVLYILKKSHLMSISLFCHSLVVLKKINKKIYWWHCIQLLHIRET